MAEQLQPESETIEPGSEIAKSLYSKAMQRHHDYYVRLRKEGKLLEEDRPQYELAMRRQKENLVKSL